MMLEFGTVGVATGWLARLTAAAFLPRRPGKRRSIEECSMPRDLAPIDPAEYGRFLELHAVASSPAGLSIARDKTTGAEYQRLLAKYGVYTVDWVFVGPPGLDPSGFPRHETILNSDCAPISGSKPLACPRAKPQVPSELLPAIERRFRELHLVGQGQTILWVGRQATMETLCMWHRGCDCFLSPPNRCPWHGDDWDALEPLVRRLLTYMAELEQAELHELFPAVWGRDYADGTGRSDLSTAQSKANAFLRRRQWHRVLEKPRGQAILRWA
jgi:hypothetical protein